MKMTFFAIHLHMAKKSNLIYGRHPILDTINAGGSVDKIFLQKNISKDFETEIRQACRKFGIPMQYVPKDKLNRLTSKNHQGIVAFLSMVEYKKLEDIIPFIYEQSSVPLFLLLDGITDVRNFGAIARSAELCGVQAIIVPQKGGAAINEDAMKTSAGALAKIQVCRETSLRKAIELLKLNGIKAIGASLQAKSALYDMDMVGPTAIVLGSEGAGISRDITKLLDDHFLIPQVGTTDSFNVSVAAGITLYEVMRQNQTK